MQKKNKLFLKICCAFCKKLKKKIQLTEIETEIKYSGKNVFNFSFSIFFFICFLGLKNVLLFIIVFTKHSD